ncbi:PASTA domain-containing protein [Amycolatopsis speibonae]|uniref:PASTA domain-containing protein n=1 Tax=Amycolatopsis speibonae TaxID=1450224 RepID=A0ABV7P233_9PSEU
MPDFVGKQALDVWLSGHDAGLLLQGPDPDSPHPLLNGVVVAQLPAPGTRLRPMERGGHPDSRKR